MPKSVAPKVGVSTRYVDRRRELINRLDRENPAYTHVFRDSSVTVEELEMSGQEYVRNDTYSKTGNAEVMKWRRDSVARIKRDDYDLQREEMTEDSAQMVKNMYAGEKTPDSEWKVSDPGRRIAKPKDPSEIGKEGGS